MTQQLEQDIESVKNRLIGCGVRCLQLADRHNTIVTRLVDTSEVAAECASLPGDMPLRVWLTPNLFNLRA